jgi:hypothetical protein
MTCSITIGFGVSTSVLVYMPSVHTDWNGVLVPPTVTTASIMACRLFRELKLGLFVGPVSDGAISQLVFKEMCIIPSHHHGDAFGLHNFDDATVHAGIGGKREALTDENCSEGDIELGDVGPSPCG